MTATIAPIANIFVCIDCMIGHENEGDTIGYRVNGYLFPIGDLTANWDSETGEGMRDFSSNSCEGCSSPLAGARYRYAVWTWA